MSTENKKRLTPEERGRLMIDLLTYDTYKKFQGGDEFHDKIVALIQDYNMIACELDECASKKVDVDLNPEETEWVNSFVDAILSDQKGLGIRIIDPSTFHQNGVKRSSGRYPWKSPKPKMHDILFKTRIEAYECVKKIQKIFDYYGVVSIADIYDMAGILNVDGYNSICYGWYDISMITITEINTGLRSKYQIILPPPVLLK